MIVHFGGYSSQMGGLNLEQNPCIFTCYRESGGLNHTYFTYDWHLGGCSSQMGGLNHTYFTYDRALGRFHAAVGWVLGPTWVEKLRTHACSHAGRLNL